MSEACNIGPKGVRSRVVGAVLMLVAAGAMVAYCFAADVPRTWRLLVFVPVFVACLNLFQARAKT